MVQCYGELRSPSSYIEKDFDGESDQVQMSTITTERKTGPREIGSECGTFPLSGVNKTVLESNPWSEFIGMFKDDADFANVKKNIAEYRKSNDADNTLP